MVLDQPKLCEQSEGVQDHGSVKNWFVFPVTRQLNFIGHCYIFVSHAFPTLDTSLHIEAVFLIIRGANLLVGPTPN